MKPYEKVIASLYDRLPAYQRIGKPAFKKDLTNIRALCDAIGDPHRDFASIHIAGTNGKGSVANMLASILQEAGFRTGLYTSPHISDFRERIQVDGRLIHKNSVIAFARRNAALIDRVQPSFFELTVAMAFDYFRRQRIDIAVVETGLGGRLDSTNIIHPELSVITRIGLEHQDMLGHTLEAIAGEKAGIIKPGTPVVIGRHQAETAPVFKQRAAALQSPLYFADAVYDIGAAHYRNGKLHVTLRSAESGAEFHFRTDLAAAYQAENLRTAVTAAEVFAEAADREIPEAALDRGLSRVTLNNIFRGRWQIIRKSPQVVLDASHNADGIEALMRQVRDSPHRKLHLIYGCVADKDLGAILPLLPRDAVCYVTKPDIFRALPSAELKDAFEAAGLSVALEEPDPLKCLEAALKHSRPEDLILITGSIFLLAPFLET